MIQTIRLSIVVLVSLNTFFIAAHLNDSAFRKRYGANSPIINAPLYFQKVPHKKNIDSYRKSQKKISKEKDKKRKI